MAIVLTFDLVRWSVCAEVCRLAVVAVLHGEVYHPGLPETLHPQAAGGVLIVEVASPWNTADSTTQIHTCAGTLMARSRDARDNCGSCQPLLTPPPPLRCATCSLCNRCARAYCSKGPRLLNHSIRDSIPGTFSFFIQLWGVRLPLNRKPCA
jgi:hypothetical protein